MEASATVDLALDQHLTGTRVRLWPYAARVGYPPTQLYALWDLFEREDLWRRVMYQRQHDLQAFKTLETFLPWWDARHILLVEDLEGGGLVDLGGVVWFDDVVPGLRASMSIVYARRLWGDAAREATRLGMGYAFQYLGLQALWGFTPWKLAARHAMDCGWRYHTTLPNWVVLRGKPMPVHLVTITRAAWAGQLREEEEA